MAEVLAPIAALLVAGLTAGTSEPGAEPAAEAAPAGATRAPAPVYRLSLAADGAVMAASGLAIVIPAALASDLIHRRCPCDPSEVNLFDRGAIGNQSAAAATASDVTVVAAVLVPPILDLADVGASEAFWTDAVVFTQVLLVNGALTQLAKYAVQRPLPRTYAGDPSLVSSPGGYRSFYSGHTSITAAALTATAMTARLRHGERGWPWAIAGVVTASVAVERVAGGWHFPSDVVVGALAGTAVGVVVPWLHARGPAPVTLVPVQRGIGVAVRF